MPFSRKLISSLILLGFPATPSSAVLIPITNIAACKIGLDGDFEATSIVYSPEVGRETEVEIGQAIIITSEGSVMNGALTIPRDLNLNGENGKGFSLVVPAGKYEPGFIGYGKAYLIADAVFRYGEGKPRTGWAKPQTTVFLDHTDSHYRARVSFGLSTKTLDLPQDGLTVEKCIYPETKGFRRELIYSGTAKGTISLQYRESQHGLARTAFTQDLNYDLAAGNEIGYKGARFLIIKATNVSLRFKLLKPLE